MKLVELKVVEFLFQILKTLNVDDKVCFFLFNSVVKLIVIYYMGTNLEVYCCGGSTESTFKL